MISPEKLVLFLIKTWDKHGLLLVGVTSFASDARVSISFQGRGDSLGSFTHGRLFGERKKKGSFFKFTSAHYLIPPIFFFFSLDRHFVLGYNSPFGSTHLYADRKAAGLLHLWALGWLGKSRNMELLLHFLVVTLAPDSFTKCAVKVSPSGTRPLIFHTKMGSLEYIRDSSIKKIILQMDKYN